MQEKAPAVLSPPKLFKILSVFIVLPGLSDHNSVILESRSNLVFQTDRSDYRRW